MSLVRSLFPRAILAAALSCAVLTGCVSTADLRDQQAEQLRRLCVSFASRVNQPPRVMRRIQARDPQEFRVGHDGIRRGLDVLRRC
jgi:hypothetical protein